MCRAVSLYPVEKTGLLEVLLASARRLFPDSSRIDKLFTGFCFTAYVRCAAPNMALSIG